MGRHDQGEPVTILEAEQQTSRPRTAHGSVNGGRALELLEGDAALDRADVGAQAAADAVVAVHPQP